MQTIKQIKFLLISIVILLIIGTVFVWASDSASDYYIELEPKDVTMSTISTEYGDVTINQYYTNDPNTPALTATGSQIPSYIIFTSSDSQVAYVNGGKLYSGSKEGTATITATYNPGEQEKIRTATMNVVVATTNTPNSISSDKSSYSLNLTDNNKSFTVSLNYTDGNKQDITNLCTYSSSDSTIITVDAEKRVIENKKKVGTATITATYEGKTTSFTVTVSDYYIEIEPKDPAISEMNKEYGNIIIKQYNSSDTSTPVQTVSGSQIPSYITFTSSDSQIAYVNGGKLYSGSKEGTTTITATCNPGTAELTRTATTKVTVKEGVVSQSQTGYTVSSLTSDKESYILELVGASTPLVITATFEDGTKKDVTSECTYNVTDSTIVTVNTETKTIDDNNKAGKTIITAFYQGKMVMFDAVVRDYYIEVEPNNVNISGLNAEYGDVTIKQYFTTDTQNPNLIISGDKIPSKITFTSSDSTVAYVSNGKLYSGNKEGAATITATYDPGYQNMIRTAQMQVVVGESDILCEISSDKESYLLSSSGIDTKITVYAKYSSGSQQDVTALCSYTSSNPDIATVEGSTKTLENKKKVGITTITATYKDKTASFTVTVADYNKDYYIEVEPSTVTIDGAGKEYGEITLKQYYTTDKTNPVQVAKGSNIASYVIFESSNSNIAYVKGGKLYSGTSSGKATITVTCDPLGTGKAEIVRTAKIEVAVTDAKPAKPVFSKKIESNTATVTIIYSDNSAIKEYKISKNGTYNKYTAPILINKNDTVIYARCQSPSGVWSEEADYTVKGIVDQEQTKPPVITNYEDLGEEHWAYKSIMEMTKMGILEGMGDGTFKPDDQITREQFAKVLVLALNKPLSNPQTPTFSDISKENWSFAYVESVKQYLNGYNIGDSYYFNGNDYAKREDMVAAIVLAKGLDKQTPDLKVLDAFVDSNDISLHLKNIIAIAVKNKIIQGYDNGCLGPQNTLTRAEACELMYRLINY